MRTVCHRCGSELPSEGGFLSPFCPACGAPQLYLPESALADQPAVNAEGVAVPPPPLPRQIDWQAAMRCSVLVALIAVVLSVVSLRVPGISFLNTIWILTASMTTLALYQRRRPLAWMDAGIGARIGLTAGFLLVVLITTAMAIAGLVARFGLHAMSGFDTSFAQMLAQARQVALSGPTPPPVEVLRIYEIPEFQAGIALASVGFSAFILLVFNVCGGALSGLLRTRRGVRV